MIENKPICAARLRIGTRVWHILTDDLGQTVQECGLYGLQPTRLTPLYTEPKSVKLWTIQELTQELEKH